MLKIAQLRAAKGLSQVDLAKQLGVSGPAVAAWEIGRSYPSAERLPDIARVLDCTISDLFEGNKHEKEGEN